MKNKLQGILTFLHESEKLKTVLRHSYLSTGQQEDVAQHTWRMALMAVVLHTEMEEKINLERVLKMILVHDLPEVYTGDFPTTKRRPANKHALEEAALEKLVSPLGSAVRREIVTLWLEYEKAETAEAKFAKALDKLEAQIQHNEADLSTWELDEYPLGLIYGDDKVAHSKILKQFRKLVRKETEKKFSQAKKPISIIELAGCVIIDGKSVLLLHRKKKDWYELPGGKIETNEAPEEAAKRELKEELGCDISITRKLGVGSFNEGEQGFIYHWFLATLNHEQSPAVQEIQKFDHFKYISLKRLKAHHLSPNMQNLAKNIDQFIS